MSRYQTGHILGAFPVRFYQTESREGQVTRVRKSHREASESKGGPVGRFSTKRWG